MAPQLRKWISSSLFSMCSISMILCNKFLATHLHNMQLVILVQTAGACVCYAVCWRFLPSEETANFSLETFKQVYPLTLLFLGMLYTSIMSFKYLSVPSMVVYKNFTLVFTLVGDALLYSAVIVPKQVVCIFIMAIGALASSYEDMDFNLMGLSYITLNCMAQALFILMSKHIQNKHDLSSWKVSACNNCLSSIALLVFMVVVEQENMASMYDMVALQDTTTRSILALSSFISALAGVCQFWCISCTSSFHVCVLGALNKAPVTVLGALIFTANISPSGWLLISVNIIAAAVYSIDSASSRAAGAPER